MTGLRPGVSRALLGLVVFVGAMACSPQGGIDVADLEAQLASQVRAEIAIAFPEVASSEIDIGVTCPASIEPNEDQAIDLDCQVRLGAQNSEANVRVGGPEGRDIVAAELQDRMVSARAVQDLVATTLSAELELATTVTCPYPVMFLPPEAALTCTATDPAGIERSLLLSVNDAGEVQVALA